MKKILLAFIALSSVAMADSIPTNVYLRAEGDLVGGYESFKLEGDQLLDKGFKGFGWGISAEVTTNFTENLEFGLGLGYQKHGKAKSTSIPDDDYPEFADTFRFDGYDSFPLYATAKYNFAPIHNIVPYIKGNLGYSFNRTNNKLKADIVDYDVTDENGTVIEKPVIVSESFDTKVKNGIYAGIGVGMEYNNLIVDLMYQWNQAKLDISGYDEDDGHWSESAKQNYSRLTLGVGYKFNF